MTQSPGWQAHADRMYAHGTDWVSDLVDAYADEFAVNGQADARNYVTGLALADELTRDSLAVALALAVEQLHQLGGER